MIVFARFYGDLCKPWWCALLVNGFTTGRKKSTHNKYIHSEMSISYCDMCWAYMISWYLDDMIYHATIVNRVTSHIQRLIVVTIFSISTKRNKHLNMPKFVVRLSFTVLPSTYCHIKWYRKLGDKVVSMC